MDSVQIVINGIEYRQVPLHNHLFCSTDGELVSIGRSYVHRITKTVASNGYEVVNTANKVVYVHRLVASTFLPNADNLPHVNHKNSDRTDNRAVNLEWCTVKENAEHSARTGGASKYKKAVVAVSLCDGSGLWFDSLMLAERLGFRQSSISMCLAGKQASHKGYTWELY